MTHSLDIVIYDVEVTVEYYFDNDVYDNTYPVIEVINHKGENIIDLMNPSAIALCEEQITMHYADLEFFGNDD